MRRDSNDLSLVFEGEAGQGIQTVTAALLPVLRKIGFHVFSSTEYMSRIRGGSNTTQIRITGDKREAYVGRIDMLFALSRHALEHLERRLTADTVVFAEKGQFGDRACANCIDTPLKEMAEKAGGMLFANTVAAGVVLGVLGVPPDNFIAYLKEQFAAKGDETVSKNIVAAKLGYDFGVQCPAAGRFVLPEPGVQDPDSLLMDGNSALGIGAVAAGCNFICSYPMSPGTGLLTFLAARSKEFGIVVDQAEDEIAAINAGLGASYAGAKSLVTTSGGGFSLMQEGMSLAGMIETPVVVHLGQRPGPATGLPTRTEQGDLNLALHAGHGDFARAIFAPGNLEETIEAIQRAFDVAQRYQIPVVVLTDQYLLDAVSTIAVSRVRRIPVSSGIVPTVDGYRRYELTPDGISPRGVPGYGEGIVRVDSDEHDESGLITESFEMRRLMVEKRLARREGIRREAMPPTLIGDPDSAETLVVAWGSTRGVLEEALDMLETTRIAGVHFAQPYPVNPSATDLFGDRRIAVLENNATGQFADLLTLQTGKTVTHSILKATGEPFSVEEVVEALRELDHD
jgi:2-oxoglutarate ferredoxin oxidoreductase subunit alpha